MTGQSKEILRDSEEWKDSAMNKWLAGTLSKDWTSEVVVAERGLLHPQGLQGQPQLEHGGLQDCLPRGAWEA